MIPKSEIPRAQSEPLDIEDAVLSAMLWQAAGLLDASSDTQPASSFGHLLNALLSIREESSSLRALLQHIPQAFGSGLLLHTLFARLFPDVMRPILGTVPDSPLPTLTAREREVLR